MIAIVDGGSTKGDWMIVNEAGDILFNTKTVGFNPNIFDSKLIPTEILANDTLSNIRFDIKHVYFYGAGCGIQENKDLISEAFYKVFTNAKIFVKDDLTAAAYAAYNGKPAMVGILGTGSNACFFDGTKIMRRLPSLGFLLGDEGSGCALGKRVLKGYFMDKMPPFLKQEFDNQYNLDIDTLIRNVYRSPKTNAYIAQFSEFILPRKKDAYFQHMVYEELSEFIETQILPYPESKNCEVNFIGSIAYFYEDILRVVAADKHIKIGKIVQKPIVSLLDYHLLYVFPEFKS